MKSQSKNETSVWKLTLEDKYGEFTLDFTDFSKTSRVLYLRQAFIDEIAENIRKYEHYQAAKSVKRVIDTDDNEIDINKIYVLLGVFKDESRIGFMFFKTEAGALVLVGVWPSEFADKMKEDIKLFEGALTSIIESPQDWIRVDFLLAV